MRLPALLHNAAAAQRAAGALRQDGAREENRGNNGVKARLEERPGEAGLHRGKGPTLPAVRNASEGAEDGGESDTPHAALRQGRDAVGDVFVARGNVPRVVEGGREHGGENLGGVLNTNFHRHEMRGTGRRRRRGGGRG